jgi:hypothetical protein
MDSRCFSLTLSFLAILDWEVSQGRAFSSLNRGFSRLLHFVVIVASGSVSAPLRLRGPECRGVHLLVHAAAITGEHF